LEHGEATQFLFGTTMDDVAFLSQVPLLASLKTDHLAGLAAKLKVRHYRRNEVIFHQDDPGMDLHIIKTGQVKIATVSPEGEEIIMALLTTGDSFGEIALLDGKPRSATAVAMEPTQTLTLSRDDFLTAIAANVEMMTAVLASVAAGWRKTSHLLEDATFLDLPARLAKRLLELAEKHGVKTSEGTEIDLRLTQQDLAAAAGVSRVAINRQLRLFQDSGLISLDKKRIIVLRPEELRKRIY
jgi:CRP/FNR family cyclic AMP-dependent transcriptional regulator